MRSAFTERALCRLGAFAMLAGALVVLGGCGGAYKGLSAGSFERGEAEYNDESWYDAVEDLRTFIRRAPTDPRAPQAQYMIGMSRYNDEDYPVAAVEFEILRSDYPTSDLVDESWYMQGMCYVQQVPSTQMDQATTHQAVDHFVKYLREYPGGNHRAEVEEQLSELNRHLDQKDLDSARLYRRLKRWQAAAVTIDTLLETRPDSELRPEMLLLSGDVHARRFELQAARSAYEQFLRDYPDHDGANRARSALEKIDGKVTVGEGT